MKRILLMLLSMILLVSVVAPITSAAAPERETPVPMVDERITGIFDANNIDYTVTDATITLVDKSVNNVTKANKALIAAFKADENLQKATVTYPTAWQHLVNYDFRASKKFKGATKTAFITAFAAYLKNIYTPWRELAAAAGAGYGIYYFVNSETEDLYTFVTHHYRTMGPGFVDHNGTVYGDYEIRKQMRITKNSNNTGGQYVVDTRRGTSTVPWF